MEHTLKFRDDKLYAVYHGKEREIFLGPTIAKDIGEVLRYRIRYALQEIIKEAS